MTREDVVQAALTVRQYCADRNCKCLGCPFLIQFEGCYFMGNWKPGNRDFEMGWMQIEDAGDEE